MEMNGIKSWFTHTMQSVFKISHAMPAALYAEIIPKESTQESFADPVEFLLCMTTCLPNLGHGTLHLSMCRVNATNKDT